MGDIIMDINYWIGKQSIGHNNHYVLFFDDCPYDDEIIAKVLKIDVGFIRDYFIEECNGRLANFYHTIFHTVFNMQEDVNKAANWLNSIEVANTLANSI